ncbi:MAG: ankyrin repeat domain-containing protein [Rhodobacteraceae bacterium]|nr:ankyrin repeat domain-containing protein [Paracoccaceae bacterium]
MNWWSIVCDLVFAGMKQQSDPESELTDGPIRRSDPLTAAQASLPPQLEQGDVANGAIRQLINDPDFDLDTPCDDRGNTLLVYALSQNNAAGARMLLAAGASQEVQDTQGRRPCETECAVVETLIADGLMQDLRPAHRRESAGPP